MALVYRDVFTVREINIAVSPLPGIRVHPNECHGYLMPRLEVPHVPDLLAGNKMDMRIVH
jgi:hypothetical protein